MKKILSLPIFILILLYINQSYTQKNLIIDTDGSVDDFLAIQYLLVQRQFKVNIKAILVTGSGQAACEYGVKNIRKLLVFTEIQQDIPVVCGQNYPTQGYFQYSEIFRNVANLEYYPDIDIKVQSSNSEAAPDFLIKILENEKGKVDILTLGPLTNLALALQKNKNIVKKINTLYIRGGSILDEGNVFNPRQNPNTQNKKSEWNFYVDSQAVQQVYSSNIPIKQFGLEITNEIPIDDDFLNTMRLSLLNNVVPEQYIIQSLKFLQLLSSLQDTFDYTKIYMQEVFASVAYLNDQVCTKYKSLNLEVISEIKEQSEETYYEQQTREEANLFPTEGRQTLTDERNGEIIISKSAQNNIQVCIEIDREFFDKALITHLSGEFIKKEKKQIKTEL